MRFYKNGDHILVSETPLSEGKELIANTTDGVCEKHIPVLEQHGDHVTVKVGSIEHPMLEAHHIAFVILETEKGYQKHDFVPGEQPVAVFALAEGEKPVAAYEYCNLHGFWKAEI